MDSSVTAMLRELGWLDLSQRRKHLRLTLFYKIVHSLLTVPHEDILKKPDPRLRKTNNQNFRPLAPKFDVYRYAFFNNTIKDWNILPQVLVDSPSPDSFKEGLYRAARPTASMPLAASHLDGRPVPAGGSRN